MDRIGRQRKHRGSTCQHRLCRQVQHTCVCEQAPQQQATRQALACTAACGSVPGRIFMGSAHVAAGTLCWGSARGGSAVPGAARTTPSGVCTPFCVPLPAGCRPGALSVCADGHPIIHVQGNQHSPASAQLCCGQMCTARPSHRCHSAPHRSLTPSDQACCPAWQPCSTPTLSKWHHSVLYRAGWHLAPVGACKGRRAQAQCSARADRPAGTAGRCAWDCARHLQLSRAVGERARCALRTGAILRGARASGCAAKHTAQAGRPRSSPCLEADTQLGLVQVRALGASRSGRRCLRTRAHAQAPGATAGPPAAAQGPYLGRPGRVLEPALVPPRTVPLGPERAQGRRRARVWRLCLLGGRHQAPRGCRQGARAAQGWTRLMLPDAVGGPCLLSRPAEAGLQALRRPCAAPRFSPSVSGVLCDFGCSALYAAEGAMLLPAQRPGFAGQQLCGHRLPARQGVHTGRPGRLTVQARTLEPAVGLWATKQGMDQFFHPDGRCDACTILSFEPGNIVTQVPPAEGARSRISWPVRPAPLALCRALLAAGPSWQAPAATAALAQPLRPRAPATGKDAREGRLHGRPGGLPGHRGQGLQPGPAQGDPAAGQGAQARGRALQKGGRARAADPARVQGAPPCGWGSLLHTRCSPWTCCLWAPCPARSRPAEARRVRPRQVQSAEGYEPGQQLNFEEVFPEGSKVDIAGRTIGKGFAGVWLLTAVQTAAADRAAAAAQAEQRAPPTACARSALHSSCVQATSRGGTTRGGP